MRTGGPIVADYPNRSVQLGITSWGPEGKIRSFIFMCLNLVYLMLFSFILSIGCSVENLPSVLARVSAQYDWIIETICGELGGEDCPDDDDGQDCFDLSDKDTNEQYTEEDDMLPGFIRTMINNGKIESSVSVSSVRPSTREQQKREREMSRMLMNDITSLSVSMKGIFDSCDQFS